MELLAMELKDILAILIASMLVFLPFVILFNPKVVAKMKQKNEEKKNENKKEEANNVLENNQNVTLDKQITYNEENTNQEVNQPENEQNITEQKTNSNVSYTVTSFKDEENNN